MIAADAQKFFTLRVKRGLITDGMHRYIRHPNYLGEMMIYGSFAMMVWHWFPVLVLAPLRVARTTWPDEIAKWEAAGGKAEAAWDNLQLGLGYTYLNTEVLELEDFSALVAGAGATPAALSTSEGEELPYSPHNQAVVNARYSVPVPAKCV